MTKKLMLFALAGALSLAVFISVYIYQNSTICGSDLTKSIADKFELVVKGFGVVMPHNPIVIRGFKFNEENGTSFSFEYSEGALSDDGYESMEQVEVTGYTIDEANGTVRASLFLGNFIAKSEEFSVSFAGMEMTREGDIKLRKGFDVRKNCKQHLKNLSAEEAKEIEENLRKIAAGEKGDVPVFLWQLEE